MGYNAKLRTLKHAHTGTNHASFPSHDLDIVSANTMEQATTIGNHMCSNGANKLAGIVSP
jgi:hypothetical protein